MLASYLSVLRRRRWALIVLVLIFESLIFSYLSSRPMVYQSIAVLEIGSTNLSDTLLGQTPGYVDPVRRAATESDVVMSAPVEALALEVLDDDGRLDDDGGIPGTVRAAPRATSNYIDVVSTASTPADAQAVADAFAASYLEHRLEKLRGESNVLELRLTAGLDEAERDVARLEAADDADSLELTAARESVERTQDLLQNLRFLRSVNGSDVSLAFPAGLPDDPLNERSPAEAIGISLVGAIFLSLGIIFVLELLQDTVRSQEEAERLTSTPVLGVITRRSARADRTTRSVAAGADRPPVAPGAGLRLGVLARSGGAMPASVLVTGLPEDGADVSLVGWALASACADSGQEVVLVGDVAPDAPGAADLTTGPTLVDLGDHQLRVVRVPGTTVSWCPLTAADGTQGLLDVPFPKSALAQLASSFDLVVIASGTSGVRPTDLTHLAEVTIVVCSFGRTSARTLLELLGAFEHRGSGVLGLAATSAATDGTTAGRRRLRRRSRGGTAPMASAADDERTARARQTALAPASAVSPGPGTSGAVGGDEAVPGGELVPEGATWNHAPVSEVGASGSRRADVAGEGT